MGMHDSMNFPDETQMGDWNDDSHDNMGFANFDDAGYNTHNTNTNSKGKPRKDRSKRRTSATGGNGRSKSLDNAFPDDGELAIEDLFADKNKWEDQTMASSTGSGSCGSSGNDKMDYFASEGDFNKSFSHSSSSLTMRPNNGGGTRLARRGRRVASRHSSLSSLDVETLELQMVARKAAQEAAEGEGTPKKSSKKGGTKSSKKKKENRRLSMPSAPSSSAANDDSVSVATKDSIKVSKSNRRKSLDNSNEEIMDKDMAAVMQKKIAFAKMLREQAEAAKQKAAKSAGKPAAEPKVEDAMDRIKLAYLANKKKERQNSKGSLDEE
eukprot:CAMPEP_0168767640 /NCGR_PEP_ID=MMETSP0725-20121227/1465_1 /TAXON_ID=265536 /ORGANISM="Amphiprora sp., Strain CCMP467" /LENGTH=323 /DNA_ID=CAMNT_0008816973 /DNA_START=137 /DNA_END=1108 /DNA_ORIENTATION=+